MSAVNDEKGVVGGRWVRDIHESFLLQARGVNVHGLSAFTAPHTNAAPRLLPGVECSAVDADEKSALKGGVSDLSRRSSRDDWALRRACYFSFPRF